MILSVCSYVQTGSTVHSVIYANKTQPFSLRHLCNNLPSAQKRVYWSDKCWIHKRGFAEPRHVTLLKAFQLVINLQALMQRDRSWTTLWETGLQLWGMRTLVSGTYESAERVDLFQEIKEGERCDAVVRISGIVTPSKQQLECWAAFFGPRGADGGMSDSTRPRRPGRILLWKCWETTAGLHVEREHITCY